MTTSGTDLKEAAARNVTLSDDSLSVDLADGRTIIVPLAWFPRLSHATPPERAKWRLIGGGSGIHWPDLDENVSVGSLLTGRRSGESQDSLRRWLADRATHQSNIPEDISQQVNRGLIDDLPSMKGEREP